MPKGDTVGSLSDIIRAVATYHQDTDASHRLFFSTSNPDFAIQFIADTTSEVEKKLSDRLNETDLRSSLAILSRIEAAFRIDYRERCKQKKSDDISIAFRALNRKRGNKVRFEDDILQMWGEKYPATKQLVSELRGAFKFRHWLAHGMYWTPKLARKYDYLGVYTLADAVSTEFPLFN